MVIVRADCHGRFVYEVNEGRIGCIGDSVRHDVHRVGAHGDDLCSRVDQHLGVLGEQCAGSLPVTLLLDRLDVSEVVTPDDEVG